MAQKQAPSEENSRQALSSAYFLVDRGNELFLEGVRTISEGRGDEGRRLIDQSTELFRAAASRSAKFEKPGAFREMAVERKMEDGQPLKTENGSAVFFRVQPHFIHNYAKAMAGMNENMSITDPELASLIVKLWDAGTELENMLAGGASRKRLVPDRNLKEKVQSLFKDNELSDKKKEQHESVEDFFKEAEKRFKELEKEIARLARKIDPTLKERKRNRGNLDGEGLNEFKGLLAEEGGRSGRNYSNPLFVAEDRYLRMLEYVFEGTRMGVTTFKSDTLSSIPKKVE
jgi:hypothetical protein